jgi:hypothetical protein
VPGQPRDAVIAYPGGIRVRYRWAGSGEGSAVFALTEAGGALTDYGGMVNSDFEQLCRAELRVETPAGAWTARLASRIFDDPRGLFWDSEGLFLVGYGFHTYAFEARGGSLAWLHETRTPLVAVLGSSRLRHVVVQAELETFAIEPDGDVGWRIGHSDVVAEAELVGGRLVLRSYGGQLVALDPATGRSVG